MTPSLNSEQASELKLVDKLIEREDFEECLKDACGSVFQMESNMRALLIRNLGIGDSANSTLDRFEEFYDRMRDSSFKPEFTFSPESSSELRKEDAARNSDVIFENDLESELVKMLERDQVRFLFNQFLKSINFEIAGRVVELGAGSCWLAAEFSRLDKVQEVVAVELSDNELLIKGSVGLEQFQARMDKMSFLVGNFNAECLEPNSFDVVVFARALHHSNDAKMSLRQACRLLKPGGRLIAFSEHVLPRIISRERKRDVKRRTTAEHTLSEYRRIFCEVGLRMTAVPYFENNYRSFMGFTYNDRYLVQYTPRRFLNDLFYGRFHMVGIKE